MTSSSAVRALQPSDELAPGTRVGEYEVLEKIGEGGMGMVYGARHPLIGKRAAIKVIHRELSASAEASERFIREAQAVNQIGHPNIVDVFGFGELPDGRRFFVMEWLRGESLAARLRRPLTLGEALAILEAIAKALGAAHEAGVLHRDLKPDNVFLQERKGEAPVVKILDFGLAKLQTNATDKLETTRTGAVMGTPLYISPEQAKGEKVDSATDVYSLGAMAYQMLCGQVPLRGGSAIETMAMHIAQNPLPLSRFAPTIPPQIDELVSDMLRKEPRERPSMSAVREVLGSLTLPDALIARDSRPSSPLANALTSSQVALASTTATESPAAKARRSRVPWVIGAVVVVGLVVGIVAASTSSSPSSTARPATAPSSTASSSASQVGTAPSSTAQVATAPSSTASSSASQVGTAPSSTAQVATAPSSTPSPAAAPPATPPSSAAAPSIPPSSAAAAPRPAAPAPPESADAPPAPAATSPTPRPMTTKRATVGTVVITVVGAPKAKILVDDDLVASNVLTATQSLAPGKHVVRARFKGHKPASATVQVIAGRTHNLKLTLVKQPRSVDSVKDPFEDDE